MQPEARLANQDIVNGTVRTMDKCADMQVDNLLSDKVFIGAEAKGTMIIKGRSGEPADLTPAG